MSIEDKNKIDIISTRKSNGAVVLTISDHLDWEDVTLHLKILQDKLNSYIAFIEGGQIFIDYPKSKDKQLIIEIVSQQEYTKEGIEFLEKAKPIIQSIGADLKQRVLKAI